MKKTLLMLCAAAGLVACDTDEADTQDRAGEDVEAPGVDEHVSRVFDELDADGSGALSPAEVEGHHLAHKFGRADADGNGELSQEELAGFIQEMHAKHGGRHGKGHHGDADGACEGECGEGECGHGEGHRGKGGHHGKGHMGPPEDHAKRMVEKLDADDDGQISAGEAAAKPHLAERFGELDADGDGQLTEQEIVEHHKRRRAHDQ